MRKIPTIFTRLDDGSIVNEITSGCRWVTRGEGVPIEKLDGTNIRLTVRNGIIVRVEKRRNPKPQELQKAANQGVRQLDPWYTDANRDDPADQHIFAAVDFVPQPVVLDDGEYSAEAVGPKIQGNPLGLTEPACFLFSVPSVANTLAYQYVPTGFEELRAWFQTAQSIYSPGHAPEGIVFHHPDGRRAKIKAEDFGVRTTAKPAVGTTIDQRKAPRKPPLTRE